MSEKEIDILDDERVDKEIRRWQDAIRDKMIAMGVPDDRIDGAGCDSGDPLDFTLAEVGQGIAYFLDQLEATGNHVYHTFETATQGFSETDQCARCGLLPNALMHLLAGKPSTVVPSEAAWEIARRWAEDDLPDTARLHSLTVHQLRVLAEEVLGRYFPPTEAGITPLTLTVEEIRAVIEAKQAEWEKLGDYGINREYLNRIEGSNDILDALQVLVQKPAGDSR